MNHGSAKVGDHTAVWRVVAASGKGLRQFSGTHTTNYAAAYEKRVEFHLPATEQRSRSNSTRNVLILLCMFAELPGAFFIHVCWINWYVYFAFLLNYLGLYLFMFTGLPGTFIMKA